MKSRLRLRNFKIFRELNLLNWKTTKSIITNSNLKKSQREKHQRCHPPIMIPLLQIMNNRLPFFKLKMFRWIPIAPRRPKRQSVDRSSQRQVNYVKSLLMDVTINVSSWNSKCSGWSAAFAWSFWSFVTLSDKLWIRSCNVFQET